MYVYVCVCVRSGIVITSELAKQTAVYLHCSMGITAPYLVSPTPDLCKYVSVWAGGLVINLGVCVCVES